MVDKQMSLAQFTELLAAVARCLPRGLTSEQAQRWITNQKMLSDVLLSTLSVTTDQVVDQTMPKHVIDCDFLPFTPSGFRMEEHHQMGKITWDPAKVSLYLSPNQQGGKVIKGEKLRWELNHMPVLNANVLDYLLAHPELIPESWKGKRIYFWGTIYRSSGDGLYVRCLCWGDGRWSWNYFWLAHYWDGDEPAAVASVPACR